MSEFYSINSILGIVGTITGIIALFISYCTYRSAKPKLKVTVKNCAHSYDEKNPKKIFFELDFAVHNCGDRGTTLNEIAMCFTENGKKRSLKEEIEQGIRKVSINPHETIDTFASFTDLVEETRKEKIDCSYIIYHTHGAYRFNATSKLKHL